jgi:restriction system protein
VPVWIIRAGPSGRLAEPFVEHDVVALGWVDVVGDLRRYDRYALTEALEDVGVPTPDQDAEELLNFRDQVTGGDLVVVPDTAAREVVVGRVTGPYDFREDSPVVDEEEGPYPHLRTVEWWGRGGRDDLPEHLRKELNGRRTLHRLPSARAWTEVAEQLRAAPRSARDPKPARAAGPRSSSPRPRAAARPAAPRTSPPPASKTLCEVCGISKPSSQFAKGSTMCNDCRADF